MIKLIEEFIKKCCKCIRKISTKKEDANCIKISPKYYLCYDNIDNYKHFIYVKTFLQKYLEYIDDVGVKYQKFIELKNNLLKVIQSNEKFFENKKVEEFFSFLD